MQNFGPQTLTIGSKTDYFTGVGWEYITIINESPYILDANFSGIGSITIPAWFQEDIRMPSGYTGQVVLNPNNYLGLTQIVSQLVSVNAWSPGELPSRQSVGLSQNFGNVVTSTATNLVNDGNIAGTTIIESTQQGSTGSNILVKNNGQVTVSQFQGGTLTQLFAILPGVTAGALNNNVIIGDSARSTLINGTLQVNGTTWCYSGIATQTSFSNTTGINCTLSGTSTQQGYVATPQSGTRNFTDFFASGAEINTVGIGYTANSIGVGYVSSSNNVGMQFTGLHAGSGIDLSGLTVSGGGPAIIVPSLPIKAASNSDVLLDTTTGTNAIRARINGTDVLAILSSFITASQYLIMNAPVFASGNGSVSGQLQLRCPIWGSDLKVALAIGVNFSTASNVNVSFPTPFGSCGMIWSGDIGATTTFGLLISGVVQTCRQVVYGAAGSAGTTSAQTVLRTANQYAFLAQADALQVQTGGFSNAIIIIGQ